MSVTVTIRHESLLLRHPGNPILTSKHWPYSVNSVFNAGATLLADGSTLLLAGWKIAVVCLISARRALGTVWMGGKLIANRH
jgi:hypothetical protein